MDADDREAEPGEAEPVQPPRIIIAFAAAADARCTIQLDRVIPEQVYAAAWLLDSVAHELRSGGLIQQVLAPDGLGAGLDLAAIMGRPRG